MQSPSTAWLASLLLVLAGCGGGGGSSSGSGDTEFRFQTETTRDIGVAVTVDGAPAPRALVLIASQIPEPEGGEIEAVIEGQVFYRGFTGTDGVASGLPVIPTLYESVDVVVQVPGTTGPYTVEALRTQWGPTAPSSRQTVSVRDLVDFTVELTSN